MNTTHVNMLSGGLASWAAGKLVAKAHGPANLIHLFADVNWEDEDTYRFLPEAVENIGGRFVRVSDGRTPWQLFHDKRFVGNNRVAPCSKTLKRDLMDAWLAENCDPACTTIYVGLMWFERHRWEGRWEKVKGVMKWKPGIRERFADAGWKAEAPLLATQMSKPDLQAWLEREGISPPRLYDEGWPSNNCGGRCVKQGQRGWAHLLKHRPESYAEVERLENAERELLGDVAMLRDRRGGKTKPLPLTVLRQRIESGQGCDMLDFGKGCECVFEE
jgi:hypothetical protein